jgi:hypothetical protein
MSNDNGATEPASRGAASVKLPTFWVTTPAGWFRSVEAQFTVKGITSEVDKYFLVLAFQQVDRLVNMEGLAGRKPSELLTVMDKLKPKDPNSFYTYHILQRMPREVRILLAHDDLQDMRALVEKADQLMALHQPQSHNAVTAMQTAELHGELAADSDGVVAESGSERQGRQEEEEQEARRQAWQAA